MLNYGPMTQEQLDEIRGRVGLMNGNPPVDIWSELVGARKAPAYHAAPKDLMNLIHEVERLRRFESIVAWWNGPCAASVRLRQTSMPTQKLQWLRISIICLGSRCSG